MGGLHHDRWKVLVGSGAALVVLGIGVSRMYLGVPYPSDVLAGWAAGALWVVLVLLAEQVWAPRRLRPLSPPRRTVTTGSAVVLTLAASLYLSSVYRDLPQPPTPTPSTPTVIAPGAVARPAKRRLPHSPQGLTG